MVKHTLNRDCCAKRRMARMTKSMQQKEDREHSISTRLRMQTGECQTTPKLNGTLKMKARSIANKIVKESPN